jgi:hypothetical protein
MKRLITFLTLALFSTPFVNAQTFADDAAQLFYTNCATCHNPNGIAPFSILTYADVTANAGIIYDAIAQKTMPPWPPEESYVAFSHSRALEEADRTLLMDWMTNGMPEGNPANTPAPPVFNGGALLGGGDLEVQIPLYMSKATSGSDDYVCFSIPSNLLQTRTIKAMEVIPGNPEIVHHCLIYIDETGSYPTDTTSGTCNGPTNATLVGGYTPGSTPLIFPNGGGLKLGMDLAANSNIVFAMHYPEGSYGQFDDTRVVFHFYDQGETGIRQVMADPIIQNWSFVLSPEQFTSVSASYSNIPVDISLLSIFPHMHLLGKSIKSYAMPPSNDTIRLINIPKWDFHWQDFYLFKNLVRIPANSSIRGEGVYDNTSSNTHNPNNPPITVYPGLNTTDEMFLIYFHYLPYMNGDENYDIEELSSLSLANFEMNETGLFDVFPNPFSTSTSIKLMGTSSVNTASVRIYDLNGRLINELIRGESFTDELILHWNGQNERGQEVSSGMYTVSVLLNGIPSYKKTIKK